jgi:hypothetical protein
VTCPCGTTLGCFTRRGCFFLRRFPFQHHFTFRVQGDQDRVAVVEFAAQQLVGQRIFHLLLDDPAQRTCAEFES